MPVGSLSEWALFVVITIDLLYYGIREHHENRIQKSTKNASKSIFRIMDCTTNPHRITGYSTFESWKKAKNFLNSITDDRFMHEHFNYKIEEVKEQKP